MIKKQYRNLQEQVLWNSQQIDGILTTKEVLNQFGIRVVGQVDYEGNLPDPATYEGEFGDAFIVGESSPYYLYIFTRPFDGETTPKWFNIGQFPAVGPQGPQGETGPQGEKGDKGDKGNIGPQGLQGRQGLQGEKGDTGEVGPQGPQGPQGEDGVIVNIRGQLSSIESLPSPDEVPFDSAYLIGEDKPYDLYIIVGDPEDDSTWQWFDAGAFTLPAITIDNQLNLLSANPVQNAVITEALIDVAKVNGNQLKDYLGNNIYPELFKRLNFIDPNFNVSGGYYNEDGSVVSNLNSSYNTQFIEVDGGKTLVWNIYYNVQILTFDSDKKFISRIQTDKKQYVILGDSVKYIKVSIYNGNFNNFLLTYLDLYQNYVSYKGYVNGKNVLDNSLLAKSFKYGELESVIGTPINLTYLNKTNYEYVNAGNGYLNDVGEFVASDGYKTIYFVVKEDEITLWYNSISSGIYLSICIANGDFGVMYSLVGVRHRISDNNMPTQANPLTLHRGQIVGITYGTNVSDFSLGVSGVIGYYNVKPKFKVDIAKSISVTKDGNDYIISMNGYTFNLLKLNIPATNLNSYDVHEVSKNGVVIEDGQMFAAVKEVGESDFMGGWDHGDDIMISMDILADGVAVTENVNCNKLDIYLETYLQRVSTKENVFKKYIHIIFENNTIKTDVNLVCLVNNFSLEIAYTGMWGQRKAYIDKVLFNCIDYDVETAPSTLDNANIESSSYILSNPDGLVNIVNKENVKARIVHYNTENDQRVKTYFVIDESKTLNENDCLKSSSIYYLN